MSTFNFDNAKIGRQYIVPGDATFDQRGQTVGQQFVVGRRINFKANDPRVDRVLQAAKAVVDGGSLDELRVALDDLGD